MAKKTGGGPARPGRPAGRRSSSAWIDLLQEPAAILNSAGTLLKLNASFLELVSDPEGARTPAAGDQAADWLQPDPPQPLPPRGHESDLERLRVRGRRGELEACVAPLPGARGVWLLALRRPLPAAAGRDLALMQEIAQGLAYALDPTEVFRRLLESLARALDFEAAACVWAGGAAPAGLLRLEVPTDTAAFEREIEAVARDLGVPWSPRPALSLERSLRYRTQDRPFVAAPAFRLAAPLHRAGRVAGLLLMASSSPALSREENRRLLLGVANQVSLTLERLATSHAAETGKFQAVIDSMPAGIMLLDASGRARLANPAARALLELLGAPAEGVLRSLGDLDLLPLIAEVARGGDPLRGRETEQGGRVLSLSLNRVRGGAFEEPMVLLVAEDVTEQRRVQEQLMQSEKLSSLGEMISGVAHELNNPLATVMGYAQLLLEAEVPAELRRMLQVVDSESVRCQKIVHNLLAFARRHPPERRRLEAGELVRGAVDLVAYALRSEGVGVQVDIEDNLPPLLGDAHQLQQVFLNILNNAHQAMENVSGPRRVRVTARRGADGVRFEFSDSGPGITPQHLPRLFDPFFTTKGVGKGTGLGLSLAYGVVREHGGSLEASNNPQGGACFAVTLPAAAALQDGAGEAALPAPRAAGSLAAGRRILIVDDEQLLASVMREALLGEGYGVEVANDGEQALRLLGEASFDLVISDVKMPNMSGRDLHREILRRNPGLAGRVLFSTGDVVNPATLRFFEETRSQYITKPFKLSDLRRVVRSLLRSQEAGA